MDDYAKYLVQPAFHSKATVMRENAAGKLKTAGDALASSGKWMKGREQDVAAKGGGRR